MMLHQPCTCFDPPPAPLPPAYPAPYPPPAPPPAPPGLRRLVTLASSFGSSFTLPVVFLTQMLPAAEAERALGFTALILLSWSPLMWSLGLAMISPGGADAADGAAGSGPAAQPAPAGGAAAEAAAALAEPPLVSAGRRVASAWRAAVSCGRRALTPPILAILAGMLAGLTPWGRALVGAGGDAAAAAAAGSPAAAPQAAVARAGGAVLRSAMDVLKMLAGGTLAAQTVVLAASLLQKPEGQQQQQQQGHGRHASGGRGPLAGLRALLLPASGAEARALATVAITRFLLLPSLMAGAGGRRAMPLGACWLGPSRPLSLAEHTSVCPCAEHVICALPARPAWLRPSLVDNCSLQLAPGEMPCRSALRPRVAVWGLGRAGLLPAAVASDPVLLLVLLLEAVMPSAQVRWLASGGCHLYSRDGWYCQQRWGWRCIVQLAACHPICTPGAGACLPALQLAALHGPLAGAPTLPRRPAPPALQNLIVLCSLSASTSGLVPLLASLLVKLYCLSILPVSAWVSCWATWLGMAVA